MEEIDAGEIVSEAIKSGFDEAVSTSYKTLSSYVKISNSKIDSIVEKERAGASIFLTSRKRVFFTHIQELNSKALEAALAKAKKAIRSIKPKSDYYGIAQGPFRYDRKAASYDKGMEGYGEKELMDIAYGSLGSLKGRDQLAGMLHANFTESNLATSGGVNEQMKSSLARLSLRLFRNGFSNQDFAASKYLSGIKPGELANSMLETSKLSEKTGRISNGAYDVIYTPSPAGSLLSNVNSMFCISSIETGSPFSGKLSKKVGSKDLTIYDSGNDSRAIGSSPYDEEGHPTETTPVIKSGIAKQYLHNHSTAVKYKTQSTGNAGLVEPDPDAMIVEHKNKAGSLHDLIEKVDKGILVTNTWYTRFSNYLSGDFSTVPRDTTIYIEKGEPRFIIKQGAIGSFVGIRISENMIRMLHALEAVADDSRQSTSWDSEGSYYITPSILVRDSAITTA